ncbi:hypothetical protein [Candidatus Avelusimicrobium faecicola]|uniref:hypothetical protein n=2 Tax=Candidatus Avelusimicrobium faecicola TaxID=3416205 RepID=UPI0015A1EEBA
MNRKITLLVCLLFLLPVFAGAQNSALKKAGKAARALVQKSGKKYPAAFKYAEATKAKKAALAATAAQKSTAQSIVLHPQAGQAAQATQTAQAAQTAHAGQAAVTRKAVHNQQASAKKAKGKKARVKNAALERINQRREEAALTRLSDDVGERITQQAVKQRTAKQAAHAKKVNAPDKNVPFHLKEALTDIVMRNPKDVMAAWAQMNSLRIKRGAVKNPDYFQQFATIYYKDNLRTLTPHMYQFFGQVAKARSPRLEKEVLGRMKELFALEGDLMAQVFPGGQDTRLRLRYLKNLESVNGEAFDPKALIFSYEQKLTDSYNMVSIRHIKPNSVLRIGRNKYPVANFNGNLDDILELYKFLLDKKSSPEGLTVIFDPKTKQMALYSKDKSVWLRVTPHEYSALNRLHIHINEIKTVNLVTNGHPSPQQVMFNFFVPISPESGSGLRHWKAEDFYQKMVLAPVEELKKTPGVNVIIGSIF